MGRGVFPSVGSRYSGHPASGIAGLFPKTGSRYGAHPDAASGVVAKAPNVAMGADCIDYYRADLGITFGVAPSVALWADQVGTNDLQQIVDILQPLQLGGGIGGKTGVYFDASAFTQFLTPAIWSRPAPGTTPTYFWGTVTLAADPITTAYLVADLDSVPVAMAINNPDFGIPGHGHLGQANATQVNTTGSAATYNNPARFEAGFSNSAADIVRFGSMSATGSSAGNVSPINMYVGAAQFAIIGELAVFKRFPTAGERASMDAYATARYAGILV